MHRFAFLVFAVPHLLFAQTWEATSIPETTRFNDVYFVTPDSGWAVSGSARIYRTTDGGQSWTEQFYQVESHLRSVGFLNARRGFAGNVGEGEFGTVDPTALYETDDAGETWTPVAVFQGPAPKGLCGMHVVNDSTVVAVGRVRGPAFFIKTTDGGATWHSQNMSEYADGLIDVYFPHPDTGFAAGLISESPDPTNDVSRGIVLATVDGGETWEERIVTSRIGEWVWKMSWPTRMTGYASLQRDNDGPVYFLKTTDGGVTWEEKLFVLFHYYVQGIGFVDEKTGWIGGNSSFPAYQTTDGGETWEPVDIGYRLNRFQFLGDSLGYAAGRIIHRFTGPPPTAISSPAVPASAIGSVYPNPFSQTASISYSLEDHDRVTVSVRDVLGRTVRSLADAVQAPGEHEILWDGLDDGGRPVAGGTYFVVLRVGETTHARPIVRIR